MNQKLLFIYNKQAGKGQISSKLSDIVDIFVKHQYDVTVYPTQAALDGQRKVKEDGAEYDLIVCAGGDGTLNEVVSSVMEMEKKVPVGYIPAGTTNDFSVTIGLPKRPLQAAEIAVGQNLLNSDIGTLNGHYFVYVAAFGLFTDVAYQTKREMKAVLGHTAYLLEGVSRLSNIPVYTLRVKHDDEELRGEYIYGMVSNSKSVGGFKNITGKDVELNDGAYEVTLIRKIENPLQLNELLGGFLSGDLQKASCVDYFKTSHLKIAGKTDIPWTLDGERGGEFRLAEIINHKQAVQIHIP